MWFSGKIGQIIGCSPQVLTPPPREILDPPLNSVFHTAGKTVSASLTTNFFFSLIWKWNDYYCGQHCFRVSLQTMTENYPIHYWRVVGLSPDMSCSTVSLCWVFRTHCHIPSVHAVIAGSNLWRGNNTNNSVHASDEMIFIGHTSLCGLHECVIQYLPESG